MTKIYSHFVEANEQAAEKTIPTKKKKILKIKDDPALEEARIRMRKAFSTYSNEPSDIIHQNLHDAKRKIKIKFENLQADHLEEMIKQVEITVDRRKHKLGRELINRITVENRQKMDN